MSPDHEAAETEGAPDAGGGGLEALAAAVAEARRRLGAGSPVDLAPLQHALAGTRATASQGVATADLLALLDELGLLTQALEREQATVKRQAGALLRHHRAESAYAAAGRRP